MKTISNHLKFYFAFIAVLRLTFLLPFVRLFDLVHVNQSDEESRVILLFSFCSSFFLLFFPA